MILPLVLALTISRPYHATNLEDVKTTKWTHIMTQGKVTLVKREEDGDWHIRLNQGKSFIVAEIIPKMSMNPPKKGECILVWGISRVDKTHGWGEIHPVEGWQPCAK